MLTEKQWRNRIKQRRDLTARASELENRVCTALETRSTSLGEVRSWLVEIDEIYEQLVTVGYSPFTKKKLFTHDDLIARLGNAEEYRALEQRQAEVIAKKKFSDRISDQRSEAERLAHPKLAQPPKCMHPERLHCDYYGEIPRCEFMEYGGTPGYWLCTAGKKSMG